MSIISTNLQFTGRPQPNTTIGGSEHRDALHTTSALTEGHSTEIEQGNKLGTIQEVEISSSRSFGSSPSNVV